MLFSLNQDGMLQTGDSTTTWFNTLSIILYLNYYLRDVPFNREGGLIKPCPSSGIAVGGDD